MLLCCLEILLVISLQMLVLPCLALVSYVSDYSKAIKTQI